LWVTLTPYCTGLVVASSRRANHLVTRHLRVSIGLGWTAIAVLLAGVFAVGGRLGVTMALASAPLIGLAFWKTGPGRDDGDDRRAAAVSAALAPGRASARAQADAPARVTTPAADGVTSSRYANMCSCRPSSRASSTPT
jgi:hypothetical protein